jgi:hypothetical protein
VDWIVLICWSAEEKCFTALKCGPELWYCIEVWKRTALVYWIVGKRTALLYWNVKRNILLYWSVEQNCVTVLKCGREMFYGIEVWNRSVLLYWSVEKNCFSVLNCVEKNSVTVYKCGTKYVTLLKGGTEFCYGIEVCNGNVLIY